MVEKRNNLQHLTDRRGFNFLLVAILVSLSLFRVSGEEESQVFYASYIDAVVLNSKASPGDRISVFDFNLQWLPMFEAEINKLPITSKSRGQLVSEATAIAASVGEFDKAVKYTEEFLAHYADDNDRVLRTFLKGEMLHAFFYETKKSQEKEKFLRDALASYDVAFDIKSLASLDQQRLVLNYLRKYHRLLIDTGLYERAIQVGSQILIYIKQPEIEAEDSSGREFELNLAEASVKLGNASDAGVILENVGRLTAPERIRILGWIQDVIKTKDMKSIGNLLEQFRAKSSVEDFPELWVASIEAETQYNLENATGNLFEELLQSKWFEKPYAEADAVVFDVLNAYAVSLERSGRDDLALKVRRVIYERVPGSVGEEKVLSE